MKRLIKEDSDFILFWVLVWTPGISVLYTLGLPQLMDAGDLQCAVDSGVLALAVLYTTFAPAFWRLWVTKPG